MQLEDEKTPFVTNTNGKDEKFVFAIPKLRSQESILRRKNKKRRRFKKHDNYSTLPDRFVDKNISSDEENINFGNFKSNKKSESVSQKML